MPRFRKRPVEVEAVQWFPGKLVPGVHGEGGSLGSEVVVDYPERSYSFAWPGVVTIHQQIAYLDPGDWVITELDGIHHYPCKPDVFEKTYEPIENSHL